MNRLSLAVVLPLLAVSCAPVAADEEYVTKGPAARAVGEAVSCISTNQIRNTRVHDDRTIDFEMTGGKVYRNTLPYKCSRLGFEEAFTYETSTSRLCNTDIIYVLESTAGEVRRGAGCGLGKFIPIEYADEPSD